MDVVFLGANNAGFAIYDWLCERDDVTVHALLTRPGQLSLIETVEPELVVAAGFDHVVPPEILDVPERGCLNVHPGLLPHARGYNPNVWSIVEGLPAGVTIHWMDEGIDTGDIVATREVPVSFEDTGKDLYERLETACYDLFVETWSDIRDGDVDAIEQRDTEATYHEKAEFTDLCELDPDETCTVRELLDRLRALTFPPFDNAYVDIDGERYYVDVSITPAAEVNEPDGVGLLDAY
ncbi:methionyl-tRNA formyltransferase [Halorientalis pallida]|uniref:phosphoribosylglycinamide formyltransferase 1 n=1 Tax=Halorientalis pallida TaxID=2479928 RepID=A0A498KRE3_9EURY|nr:formyltransferase family protein [Halorientalis pallida]RXK46962.1 formyl transferase [Halorientalis pallida]